MTSDLTRALTQLDPSPYVVSLTDEERSYYKEMLHAENSYALQLNQRGATVEHCRQGQARDNLPTNRRMFIVVPPGIEMPDPSPIIKSVNAWRAILTDAAEAQGKESTVGSRGATLPVWIGLDGIDVPFTEPRPSYTAKKITMHLQRAYRGVRLTPQEALEVLVRRLAGKKAALAHSVAKSKHDRIGRQEQEIEDLADAVNTVNSYISAGHSVSLRQFSGESWRINVRSTDNASIATTIATIALIPGDDDTRIAMAFRRKHTTDATMQTIILAGGIEMTVTY